MRHRRRQRIRRAKKSLSGKHPFNGAKVSNVNPAVAVELGLDTDSEGVVIVDVSNSTRVARMMQPGDLIIAITVCEIADVKMLEKALSAASGKPAFAVVIERKGQRTQVI